MKKNYTTLLALALSINCFAEFQFPKVFTKKKSNITNSERAEAEFLKARMYKYYDATTASFANIADTTFYTRDLNGNVTQQTVYLPTFNNSGFYVSQQTNFTYNSSNNVLSEIVMNNGFVEGNPLQNSFKRENTYDSNQNLIEWTNYSWTNNAWVPSQKVVSSYQANNLITETNYTWVDTLNNFELSFKSTFTYNSNNQITSALEQEYNNGQFVNNYQTINIVWPNTTEQDFPQSFLSQSWDQSTNTWLDASKSNSLYDGLGNRIEELYEYWTGTNWAISQKINFTFNSNKDITSEIVRVDSSANQSGQLFISRHLRNYYNPNFTLSTDTVESFNFFFGQFYYESFVNKYTYTANKNVLTNYYYNFDTTDSSYVPSSFIQNYYQQNTSSLKNVEKASVSVFPNPATNYITLNNTNTGGYFTIHNSLGALVYEQKIINATTTIDVSKYNSGIYFVKMIDAESNITIAKFTKN